MIPHCTDSQENNHPISYFFKEIKLQHWMGLQLCQPLCTAAAYRQPLSITGLAVMSCKEQDWGPLQPPTAHITELSLPPHPFTCLPISSHPFNPFPFPILFSRSRCFSL